LRCGVPARERQEYLVRRQLLEHGDGRAVRGVRADFRPLLGQHADDGRIARAEPEPMIEVERAGPEGLGALVAELVAIDHDGPHAEDAADRLVQKRGVIIRMALEEYG